MTVLHRYRRSSCQINSSRFLFFFDSVSFVFLASLKIHEIHAHKCHTLLNALPFHSIFPLTLEYIFSFQSMNIVLYFIVATLCLVLLLFFFLLLILLQQFARDILYFFIFIASSLSFSNSKLRFSIQYLDADLPVIVSSKLH